MFISLKKKTRAWAERTEDRKIAAIFSGTILRWIPSAAARNFDRNEINYKLSGPIKKSAESIARSLYTGRITFRMNSRGQKIRLGNSDQRASGLAQTGPTGQPRDLGSYNRFQRLSLQLPAMEQITSGAGDIKQSFQRQTFHYAETAAAIPAPPPSTVIVAATIVMVNEVFNGNGKTKSKRWLQRCESSSAEYRFSFVVILFLGNDV